uniref:Uncharacterized protein n=1 Tax=Hyaloperonospora arabidopsidis (strain Emoy2) TaxID=559515 RepID=M4BT58_HYAAE
MEDAEVIDVTDESVLERHKRRRESFDVEPRRTHRKTKDRVLFADVMAQEREMERLNYEKSRYHQLTCCAQLRKGETGGSPAKRSKQKRAEERRSARQKLRRTISAQLSEAVLPMSLERGNKGVQFADDQDGLHLCQREVTSGNKHVLADVTLHSTAWRNVKVETAPVNVLPDRDGVLRPFAWEMDVALDEFDEVLKSTCRLSTDFLQPKPLTVMSGTLAEARDCVQMDDRVRKAVAEATLLAKASHAARVKAIVRHTRKQIAVYLEDRPVVCAKIRASIVGRPLQISRLEKVAARALLWTAGCLPDGEERPIYSVGRSESGYSVVVHPTTVTYLSKMAPAPRSTACMFVRGTHRVEDDPIIRFVPHFIDEGTDNKAREPYISTFEHRKDTLVGMDDEVKEFVLRYAVSTCGSDQSVFEALKRTGSFSQPFANYSDILARGMRDQLWKRHLHELEARLNSGDISRHKKRAIVVILDACHAIQAVPAHLILKCLQPAEDRGIRRAPSQQYRELAIKYQEFFCRHCCVYNCRNHGRGQPVPVVRVDPRYPMVKATSKLWRRVEEEQLRSAEYVDVGMDDGEIFVSEEPVSEPAPQVDLIVKAGNDVTCNTADAVRGDFSQRSMRARTAASTKASSELNAARVHAKKMVRCKTTDVSEYLGFDGTYQAITQDRKLELLSTEYRCGPYCSKPASDPDQYEEGRGFRGTAQETLWKDSEIALLKKLEKCIGLHPCALAALLGSRSCTDVAQFIQNRNRGAPNSFDELGVMRNDVYVRNQERSNGAFGNSYEHLRRTRSQRMKDRGANHEYVPCNHDGGSCDSAQCSCMRRDHYCEKSCGCSPDCSNRFAGCHCEVGQCRTFNCPCYFAARECDPDVCISCGASELPVVVFDEESNDKTVPQLRVCGNVNILRGKMRKIGISASETHGWGAYALENVEKGEFMYEYTGSLLSQDEAERRGNVYDKTTISFLFDLTEDSVVDATRKGNKSKFANHDSMKPKCFARIMFVNGDHRIGIYAKEDIAAGDELFFDYGYSGVVPDWTQARIGSSKNDTPVKEDDGAERNLFDEPEESGLNC